MLHQTIIRPRRPADLRALTEALERQQPDSRYPMRWPLPFPAEQFIVRDTEEQAWVAERGGRVLGHVALSTVPDDELGTIWSTGAGRPRDELACVSVLFVDKDEIGKGTGGMLLRVAVDTARDQGRVPVLDVVQGHGTAVDVYRHLGWVEVGRARPEWLPESELPLLLMTLPTPPAPNSLS